MNQHRKGNAFRDINVPGDPRLLDAINRRTPQAGGMQVTHTHSGTIITGKKQRKTSGQSHPWKVISSGEDKVVVGKGFIFFPTATGASDLVMNPIKYDPQECNDNGEITVTGEGFIFAVVTVDSQAVVSDFGSLEESGMLQLLSRTGSAGINAVFAVTTPPPSGLSIVYKIAKVNLDDDDNAFVMDQYLTHNPIHDLNLFGNPS